MSINSIIPKHFIVLLLVALLSMQFAKAQQCNQEWSLPQSAPLRNVNRPGNIHALPGAVFRLQYDKNNCGCKTPKVAVGALGIKNGYAASSVTIKLRGYDCDGKPKEDEFYAHNVKSGQWDEGSGNTHRFKDLWGIKVLSVEVEYFDEEFQATYRYVSDYEKGSDETYINNRPWKKVLEDQEKAKKDLEEKQKEQAKVKEDATQQAIQKQKEQVSPRQEQQRQDQARAQENQRQQYQSQADANINAARNNPSSIGSMADLNNAQINAAAAGNNAQVQEIQQMKSQQTQQQIGELTDQATQLANSIIDLATSSGRNRYQGPSPEERYQQSINNYKSSSNPDDLIAVALNYSVKDHDYASEAFYYEKAAKLGSIDAMHRLISLYSLGADKSFPPNIQLKNKWLLISAEAIAKRIRDERDHKPLTQYEKNAWRDSVLPGDNNEVSAIAGIATALKPDPQEINPQDSINSILAFTYMTYLDQKYRNNYLSLASGNFGSLRFSEYFLAEFYLQNLDKTKSQVENLRLAVATYNVFKTMTDNYLKNGVNAKSYEKYHHPLTKSWLKDLQKRLKERIKELNLKEGDFVITTGNSNSSSVTVKKEDLKGIWNYTMSWPSASNLSPINGKITLSIDNSGAISGTIISDNGQRLNIKDAFKNGSFDGKNILFKVQTSVPEIQQEYTLVVVNKTQIDGTCKNISVHPTNRPASWDIPADIHLIR